MYDGVDAIAYIHEYPHGLVAETGQRGEALLTANYHQQIRTNRLLTMDVIPSVWGTPLYYRLPGFETDWNTDIDECPADKIMAYRRLISRACIAGLWTLRMRRSMN